jgi:hypothetical protein
MRLLLAMLPAPTPTWVLDLPYGSRELAQEFGVRWNSAAKVSTWRGDKLPHELAPFRALPLSFEWHQQFKLNERHLERPQPLLPTFIARVHQKEAAVAIKQALEAGSPGFLLADEVGVGKTLGAWDFAFNERSLKTVLIVTTSAAQAHWRHSIFHAGWREDQRIMVINYDRLQKLFTIPEDGLSSQRKKGKRKRVAKEAAPPAFDLVIFDESHKGKNPESARGLMMRKLTAAAKFTIWASATAGQDPIDLVYLAPLLAMATKSRVSSTSIADFAEWCGKQGLAVKRGAFGKIIWERNEDDLVMVRGWLFGGQVGATNGARETTANKKPILGMRRLPQDIADWPAMERQMMPISLSPEERSLYAKLWDAFVREEMRAQTAGLIKKDMALARETNRMRLRQQSSWLRIPSTQVTTEDLIEQGKRVCISVAFRATQDELVRRFEDAKIPCAFIHGQLNATEKEYQRLLFQTGKAPVIVFTVEEAISLHQGEHEGVPRITLVHDLRWSAIQMAQIEGRAHRDGSLAPTWWLAAEDTVEMDLAATMINRVIGMKAMHGDKTGDLEAINSIIQRAVALNNTR